MKSWACAWPQKSSINGQLYVVNKTCSHPDPNGKLVASLATFLFPNFRAIGKNTHTHTHPVDLRIYHRDESFAWILHLLPEAATERKLDTKERKTLADWQSMRMPKSHGNKAFQPTRFTKRLSVPCFPYGFEDLKRMHHEVSLQTMLPLNFAAPSPKVQETRSSLGVK